MKKAKIFNLMLKIANPVNYFKAVAYTANKKKLSRTEQDPQLKFYSQILKSDMLHLGHFDNTNIKFEEMSIRDIEESQMVYANNIANLITRKDGLVLDVGAGMGGLGNILAKKGCVVVCLTPDVHQAAYIRKKYLEVRVVESRYEDLAENEKYSTVINSESLQYVSLDDAFKKTDAILQDGGEWIICDFFRKKEFAATKSKSGHIYEEFLDKVEKHGWTIAENKDITNNVLPTINYVYNFGNRFLKPAIEYGLLKAEYKFPKVLFYFSELLERTTAKFEREMEVVNPEKFAKEKKYLLIKLIKSKK